MLKNPFVELSKEDMARLDEEIKIRKARQNLLDYELYVNPGYKSTKFHKFLWNFPCNRPCGAEPLCSPAPARDPTG